MEELRLFKPSIEYAEQIAEYKAEFSPEQIRATYDPDRIPGMDYLENYNSIPEWLCFLDTVKGKITWYMSVRMSDGKIIGFCCLRHNLNTMMMTRILHPMWAIRSAPVSEGKAMPKNSCGSFCRKPKGWAWIMCGSFAVTSTSAATEQFLPMAESLSTPFMVRNPA